MKTPTEPKPAVVKVKPAKPHVETVRARLAAMPLDTFAIGFQRLRAKHRTQKTQRSFGGKIVAVEPDS